MRKIIVGVILLLACKFSWAMSPTDCNDPDTVFCMDLADGSNTIARDRSKNGITGTLNGGPAWTGQNTAFPVWNPSYGSTVSAPTPPPMMIQFTKTAGEQVDTPATTVGDLSAGGSIAVCWQDTITDPDDSPQSIFEWGSAATGWVFQNKVQVSKKGAFFQNTPYSDAGGGFTNQIGDKNGHCYAASYDGTLTTDLYKDGKFISSATGVSFPVYVGQAISFAETSGAEFAGKVWGARIWNKYVKRENGEAFFTAHMNQWTGN